MRSDDRLNREEFAARAEALLSLGAGGVPDAFDVEGHWPPDGDGPGARPGPDAPADAGAGSGPPAGAPEPRPKAAELAWDQVTEVTYRRLHAFGGYENETVGATAVVMAGQDPCDVLAGLRAWVNDRLGVAVRAAAEDAEVRLAELNARIGDREYRLGQIDRDLKEARELWGRVRAFLREHKIDPGLIGEPPL